MNVSVCARARANAILQMNVQCSKHSTTTIFIKSVNETTTTMTTNPQLYIVRRKRLASICYFVFILFLLSSCPLSAPAATVTVIAACHFSAARLLLNLWFLISVSARTQPHTPRPSYERIEKLRTRAQPNVYSFYTVTVQCVCVCVHKSAIHRHQRIQYNAAYAHSAQNCVYGSHSLSIIIIIVVDCVDAGTEKNSSSCGGGVREQLEKMVKKTFAFGRD